MKPARWVLWATCAGAAVPAGWHLFQIAHIFLERKDFPGDLEWLEGHSLEEAWRATHSSEVLYGDPAQGHTSQTYSPLFPTLLGLLGRVFGLSYALGRTFSVLALVAMCALAASAVARHARERSIGWVLGLLTAGAVCAGYPTVFGYYDFARADTLAAMFVVASAATLSDRPPTTLRAAAAGLLLTLGIYTKQPAALFAPWLFLHTFARDRRAGLALGAALGVSSTLALVVLELATHGWFHRWIMSSAHHQFEPWRLPEVHSILYDYAPQLVVVIPAVAFMAGRRTVSSATLLWWGLWLSAIPASLLPFLKVGGFVNNLMWLVVLTPPLTMTWAIDVVDRPREGRPDRPLWLAGWVALFGAYLATLEYDEKPFLPSAKLWDVAGRVDAYLGSLGGGVVIPAHPFLARLHSPGIHQLLVQGYLDIEANGVTEGIDIARDIRDINPRWVILSDSDSWIEPRILRDYVLRCRIDPYYVALDYGSGPHAVYERRAPGESGPELDVPSAPKCPLPHRVAGS